MRRMIVWCVLAELLVSPAMGGTFSKSATCPSDPFIVVHPTGYDGTGADLAVDICVAPNTPSFVLPALQEAVNVWNSFAAISPNCENCLVWEEATIEPQGESLHLASGLLHELGHCAMGLDHPNHLTTSFSASRQDCPNPQSVAFDEGDDGIAGSFDDLVFPLPGTRILHWFRIADNNPAAIDATIIDQDTFSRRRLDLPANHRWPANANRVVSDALGFPNTHTVMYSFLSRGASVEGLSADDVATVEYAISGLDTDAGTTDDYTVTLAIVPNCADAEIEVSYVNFATVPFPVTNPEDTVLLCTSELEETAPPPVGQTSQHFSLVPFTLKSERLTIEINSLQPWGNVVFIDGFESGDLGQWNAALP